MINICILKICSLLNKMLKKKRNKICLVSFPDFSDNCMGVFNYIIKENLTQYEIVWLVNDLFIPDNISELQLSFKVKVVKKNSILGLLNYMTSKYIFYTHTPFNGVENLKKQIVINLWHGMPLKNIGYLDNKDEKNIPHFTYTIATSDEFQNVISKVFGVSKSKVLITGLPRNDEINKFKNILSKLKINGEIYNKKILWMPTFRKSVMAEIRNDGKHKNRKLPLLSNEELEEFNKYLRDNNDLLVIKLHPLDYLKKKDFSKLSNIKIVTNCDFKNIGEQLYSLFQEFDAFITDYSSVYFDFMLLNKPIGFVMDDLKEYSSSRGFVFEDIYDWIPGPIIKDVSELKTYIKNVNNDIDDFKDIREEVNNKTNSYSNFNNTKRLFNELGL
ncbi:CDP-glycerol glycerophosphotransferase family protein [Clostridium estertheticum]|uniref:CDP-glycerol glycerophosphotransferase family protein n=2 Tax=Clostridium estertheticum TaxID=238834 RepID=UPI001CF17B14|nr:CDP-glycerol glycerophosphotransferase family protein [Clostridium estertheticum]MCB2350352.1 CDP-glycerol glycerophosphotransferase family protein [Clostridium estertheticum]